MEKPEQIIRTKACDLLANREHSLLELQNKLLARGFALPAIQIVLQELAKQGLQSDQRFTEHFVNARRDHGYGPIRIALELTERGIAPELIAQYLDEYDECWFELARKVREKKFGGAIPQDFAAKAKQMRYLQYKGFPVTIIKKICNS